MGNDELVRVCVPGSPEWQRKRRQLLAQEGTTGRMGWWWLSFADDSGWLGGCFVQAKGFTSAIAKSHALNISPDKAEVRGWPMPETEVPPARVVNRLLSKGELEADDWLGGAADAL